MKPPFKQLFNWQLVNAVGELRRTQRVRRWGGFRAEFAPEPDKLCKELGAGLDVPALADSPLASLWFAQHFGRRCKECTKLEIKTGLRECKSARDRFNPTQGNDLTQRWSLSAWPLHKSKSMRQIMEHLLALQKLALGTKPLKLEHEAEVLKWREKVPAPILGHFDRLIARGKKGVAIARNGACGECHLRLPSGTMAALAYTNEVHLCDNCGRYLYLTEDEPPGLTNSPPPIKVPAKSRARRTRQKADLHAA